MAKFRLRGGAGEWRWERGTFNVDAQFRNGRATHRLTTSRTGADDFPSVEAAADAACERENARLAAKAAAEARR
jgi:hypothetical protein